MKVIIEKECPFCDIFFKIEIDGKKVPCDKCNQTGIIREVVLGKGE